MKKLLKFLKEFFAIVIGSIIYALGFVLFIIPKNLAPGGVSGIAIILNHFTKIPIGITIIVLNIPIFLLSFKRLGRGFLVRSIFITIFSSILIDIFTYHIKPFDVDIILASIYGGILLGIGMGIIFKFYGSTGGTDLLAQLIYEYTGLPFGSSLLVVDTLVIIFAGIAFKNIQIPLYSLLSLFISSKAIDLVQEGLTFSKAAIIVSYKSKEIKESIFKELSRGVTEYKGKGGYLQNETDILLCILPQSQISLLKEIIKREDKDAFFVIMEVTEAIGKGFKEIDSR